MFYYFFFYLETYKKKMFFLVPAIIIFLILIFSPISLKTNKTSKPTPTPCQCYDNEHNQEDWSGTVSDDGTTCLPDPYDGITDGTCPYKKGQVN